MSKEGQKKDSMSKKGLLRLRLTGHNGRKKHVVPTSLHVEHG